MYCKGCGKEVADDSKYCQHCGIKLVNNADATNKMFSITFCIGEG